MKASQYLKIINCIDDSIQLIQNDLSLSSTVDKLTSAREDIDRIARPLIETIRARGEQGLFLKTRPMSGEKRWEFFENWQLGEGAVDLYRGVIKQYAGWEYPCLELFPGTGQFLHHAVGAEPLYIADRDQWIIDQVKSQFNEYYADKRLMSYLIEEYDLSALPQSSFGFIYCINWVRFENLQGLTALAENAYSCLMPGGILLFNYNPLDQWWALEMAEEGYAYGVDTADLNKMLAETGFEVVENFKMTPEISYTICKKLGEIEYIKSSSILAKFIERPPEL